MSDKFTEDMVALIKGNQDCAPAAVRFLEEVSTTTDAQLQTSVAKLNSALKDAKLPQIYLETKDGAISAARLNNGVIVDTPLYIKPKMDKSSLDDPVLEKLATHFQAAKTLQYTCDWNLHLGRKEMKSAAEFLQERTLKLSPEDRYKVLKRASDASYSGVGSSLNAVFADLNGDGKAHELSDLAVSYMHWTRRERPSLERMSVERIDVFDPPKR